MTLTGSPRARRITIAYFTVVVLSFVVSLTRIDPLLFPGDFISFYGAGFMLSEGRGADLYDVARQAQLQEQLLAATGRDINGAVIKFFYPAALGWIFLPLTGLPLLWAYLVWSLLGVGFLIGSIYLLGEQAGGPGPSVKVLVLAGLSFFPILECLLQGQSSLFFLFLLAGFYVLLGSRMDFAAGLVLGAVFLKPQLPALLLLLLFLQRKGRVVAGCLVSILLLGLISVLTIGPAQVWGYLASAPQLLEDPGIRVELMPNLRGTLHRLDSWLGLDMRAGTLWWASILLALACLSGFVPGWLSRGPDRALGLMIAESVLLGLLLTPHLFAYDLALGIVPFLILLARIQDDPWRTRLLQLMLLIHLSAFFLNFLVPKPWLEQTLFVGLVLTVWLAAKSLRKDDSIPLEAPR